MANLLEDLKKFRVAWLDQSSGCCIKENLELDNGGTASWEWSEDLRKRLFRCRTCGKLWVESKVHAGRVYTLRKLAR